MSGSYNSALELSGPDLLYPPATSTFPLGSKVAVWLSRAGLIAAGVRPGPRGWIIKLRAGK